MDAASVAEVYLRKLDVLFIIAVEVENKTDGERRQAMQIIRQCIQLDPGSVSDAIAASLVAIATHVDDTFKEVALETLCELAVSNAKLAAAHGGIDVIVRAVLDCDSRVKVEALVLVLLTISADPRSRKYLRLENVLPRLLAPFTDRDYCHTTKTATQDGRHTSIEGQQLLAASSYAIVCVLQTWSVNPTTTRLAYTNAAFVGGADRGSSIPVRRWAFNASSSSGVRSSCRRVILRPAALRSC